MKTILIKVGGSILDDNACMNAICTEIQKIQKKGLKIIIVHGGSKAINKALAVYGIQSEWVDGIRVTSEAAIQIIEMVLCGQVNQLLVRKLNSLGINSLGLSGASEQLFLCDYYSVNHGFVGQIRKVNCDLIHRLCLEQKTIPVIASIGVNEGGEALNINADFAASYLALALKVDQLVYLTDQDGIYNKQGKPFSRLSQNNLQKLVKDTIVTEGMLVKSKAILASLENGLDKIFILNGKEPTILSETLLYSKKYGTLCEI